VRTPVDQSPPLPAPRGRLTGWLCRVLTRDPDDVASPGHRLHRAVAAIPDTTTDEDAQLALHCIYELSYRGFAGVDDAWEWAPPLLDLRRALEVHVERDLRRAVARSGLTDGATTVAEVLDRASGPSLSGHMARHGTRQQFVEFCVHRSAYQLKEADPHSWGLLRLSGPRKAALVEIQADEYGNGRVGHAHADLFADVLTALDVDGSYGAHLDAIPAVTLATDNLVTLLGSHRRLRSALLGHLAGFEMTSVAPMSAYARAARRLGLGRPVECFYGVHVEADEHHGALASSRLVGGDPEADGLSTPDILFGAAAMSVLEDRFARHLLDSWARGRSSLRTATTTASEPDERRPALAGPDRSPMLTTPRAPGVQGTTQKFCARSSIG
jgi:hypothetical protein